MAKLNKKTRDSLKDSDFGIPSKRMYPIHDKAHVEAAVKLFGHASNEDKPELAYRILKKAKEFGMDSSGWTQINEWAKKYKGKNTNESADDLNEKFEQSEFDIIEELLPSNWKKVVFFALYTEGSWEMRFYVKTQGSDKFVSCYQLSNVSKNELMQAFKKLDKIIQKERDKYSEKWTAKGMIIERDGGFKSFYDYEDHSEDSISFLKKWEEKYINDESEKEDLTEGITEAAAGASLLTVKNQLMKLVGNAFKFIGGSLVPKFTMQSTEKPQVSFDVNAVGQNVEVTPKYNGVADTLHKKKGIAFMRAAEVIADFADNVVSSFKSATPATESFEYDNEYFYALLEYADELMDECELEAYLAENPEMEFAICIGEDCLYDEEDFDAYFEGTEYDGKEETFIEFDDVFTETAHPYDDYLKKHQYDPKTNTIIVDGVRIDAGPKGSKKQRNRLNKLLRERGYDPETETILSDIPDGDGSFKRIPFNIHVTTTEGDKVVNPGAKRSNASVRPTARYDTAAHRKKMPATLINNLLAQQGMPDAETMQTLAYVYDDIMQDNANGKPLPVGVKIGDTEYPFDVLEGLVKKMDSLEGQIKDVVTTNNPPVIDVNKRELMQKPVRAHGTVSHELGHIANGDLDWDDNTKTKAYKNAADYIDFSTQPETYGQGGLMGHGALPEEYLADQYGVKHNPYSRTGADTLADMPQDFYEKRLPLIKKRQASEISDMRKKGYSEEEIARKQDEFDRRNQAMENEVYARMLSAGMYGERQRQQNEAIQRQRRQLLRDQLQQQIDSGQLTPKQISQARKKIARIDQFERDIETYQVDPKTGKPITYYTQAQRKANSALARNLADTYRLIDPRTNPDARPDTTTTTYVQDTYKRGNSRTGVKAGDVRYDRRTGKPVLIQRDTVTTQPVSAAGKKRYADRMAQLDSEREQLVRNYPKPNPTADLSTGKKRKIARAQYDSELRSGMREGIAAFDQYKKTGSIPSVQKFDTSEFEAELKTMSVDEIRERLDGIKNNIKEHQLELEQNPGDADLAQYISDCKKCAALAEKALRERTKSTSKKRTGTEVTETRVDSKKSTTDKTSTSKTSEKKTPEKKAEPTPKKTAPAKTEKPVPKESSKKSEEKPKDESKK